MVTNTKEQVEERGADLLEAGPEFEHCQSIYTAGNPHIATLCPSCAPLINSEAYRRGYAQAVEDLKLFHALKEASILEIEESNT